MHILDNYIKERFLQDIAQLFEKYNIKEEKEPLKTLLTKLLYTKNFDKSVFQLYTEHYKRNIVVLELLAAKQNLETERQVLNLVRQHITTDNITLTLAHLKNLSYSHIRQEVVNPFKIDYQGIYITNPKYFSKTNSKAYIVKAPNFYTI